MRMEKLRIGEIFTVRTGSNVHASSLAQGITPRVSAKSTDNGIIGYYDTSNIANARHYENFITVNFMGSENGVFYHPYKASVEMKVHVLTLLNHNYNRYTGLYIVTALKAALAKRFSRCGSQLSSSMLKSNNIHITLPINEKKEIDFDYMESYIRKIEEERVLQMKREHLRELENYLRSAALSSCVLTLDEINALRLFRSGRVSYEKYRIGELFNVIKQGKRIKSSQRIAGKLPFVTAGIRNRGISCCVGNAEAEVFPENSLTIDMFGSVFFRDCEYGADDHVTVLYNDVLKYNKHILMFIAPIIESQIAGKYSYAKNFYSSDAPDITITIPITKSRNPDYDFMERFVRAQHKLAVAELQRHRKREIKAAQSVIA